MPDGDFNLVKVDMFMNIMLAKPAHAMTRAELLQAARELRVLRTVRSMSTASSVYAHIAALEAQVASQYVSACGTSEATVSARELSDKLLFSSYFHYHEIYDILQQKFRIEALKLLPADAAGLIVGP